MVSARKRGRTFSAQPRRVKEGGKKCEEISVILTQQGGEEDRRNIHHRRKLVDCRFWERAESSFEQI